VMKLKIEGKSNPLIAKELGISVKDVNQIVVSQGL